MRDDTEGIKQKTLNVLRTQRVAVFVVASDAQRRLQKVLARIPEWISDKLSEVFVIDHSSGDNTVESALSCEWPNRYAPLKIYKIPADQGYGGNQKIGFSYIIEQGFDIVVLLHGGGQYAPEVLTDILAPYADGADAVLGSRFIVPGAARKGGMPLYKFIGNRILTTLQNTVMQTHLSEWHSGYRSYRTGLLRRIPFMCNSNSFEFDTEILIQAFGMGGRVVEVPIPTYNSAEIRRVNGFRYAFKCLHCILQYRLMQMGLFFDPKFDFEAWEDDSYRYRPKTAPTTVHHFLRSVPLKAGIRVLDVGGGDGRAVSEDFTRRGCRVTCIDKMVPRQLRTTEYFQVDLDLPWKNQFSGTDYDIVLAADVIEHLKRPEAALADIFYRLKTGGILYASTGNVAFIPLRLLLLLGFFNYGRKGILDRTHTRLFTVGSFRRLLLQGGFEICEVRGFGPPIRDLIGGSSTFFKVLDVLLFWLAKLRPSLFAYQIMIIAKKVPDPHSLVEQTTSFLHLADSKRSGVAASKRDFVLPPSDKT